jgi:hypothetical protein
LSRTGADPLNWLPVAILVAIMLLRVARWYFARRIRERVA